MRGINQQHVHVLLDIFNTLLTNCTVIHIHGIINFTKNCTNLAPSYSVLVHIPKTVSMFEGLH